MYLKPPNGSDCSQKIFIDNLRKLEELCTCEFGNASNELLERSSGI